ncbi:MAG: DNA polymerase, partial [Methanomassiliicoccales archaeon]
GVQKSEELHWHQGEFACMSYYASVDDCGVLFDLDEVKEFFESRKDISVWVIHNAMFDVQALRALDIHLTGKLWDTLVVERVLFSNYYSGFSLQDLAARYLDIYLEKEAYASLSDKSISRDDLYQYALTDAQVTFLIYEKQMEIMMKEPQLLKLYTYIEEPILWAVMDFKPVPVDKEAWLAQAERFRQEYEEVNAKLGINVRSSNQVKEFLKKHGIKLESTEESELAKHAGNVFVDQIILARGLSKAYTTYGENWAEKYIRDGYVRASWHTYGTVTGRITCSNPNLQQIPSSSFPIFRSFFKAKPGHKLIIADISAQEPRIVALLSNDQRMIDIFRNNSDIHTEVARAIFNDPTITKEKDKEKRQIGKRIG